MFIDWRQIYSRIAFTRKKFRETGNLKHLHRNELDKAFFVHDAA